MKTLMKKIFVSMEDMEKAFNKVRVELQNMDLLCPVL